VSWASSVPEKQKLNNITINNFRPYYHSTYLGREILLA
jgi:hypothetical protein